MLVMLIWAEQLRQTQRMEPRRAKLVADICVCSTALFLATHVEIVVVCTTCCNDLLCVVNKLQSFFVSGQLIAGMAHLGGLMINVYPMLAQEQPFNHSSFPACGLSVYLCMLSLKVPSC